MWLKREVSPGEKEAIHNLGIPGIGFVNETKRAYPMGRLAAHVLGYVDLDSSGIAGIEKYLDDQGALYTASLADPETRTAMPGQLSLDMRVQHALTDEVASAIKKYRAKAGGGIIMDVDDRRSDRAGFAPGFQSEREQQEFHDGADEHHDERRLRARLGHQGGDLRHGLRLRHGQPQEQLRRALAAGHRQRHASTTTMRSAGC